MKAHAGLAAVFVIAMGLLDPAVSGQGGTMVTSGIDIPAGATALEGVPTVRIDSAQSGTTRRVLSQAETTKQRLVVRIVDGEFYWTSRDNRRLRWDASGPFTYLSSEPGQYIRIARVNDKVEYVEHVENASGIVVTWWGELRIVIGK